MDDSMFPPGWKNRPIIPTADSHGAFEHPMRHVISERGGDGAVHEIYRYECVNDARQEYKRQLDVLFPETQRYDEWRPRENLHTALVFADEAYVACANRRLLNGRGITDCRMLARYHEYVVRFHTEVIPPHLTFEDLGTILRSIDHKFSSAIQP